MGTDDMAWREIASMTDQDLRQEVARLKACFEKGGRKDSELRDKSLYLWAILEARQPVSGGE